MKFKNIKVGDTVYLEESVRYGWNSAKHFFLAKKVERVTKTQFLAGGRRFKKDGREIGATYLFAYLEGEKERWGKDSHICDQTKEMELFVKKINLEKRIRDNIKNIDLPLNSCLEVDELLSLDNTIKGIIEKLNK